MAQTVADRFADRLLEHSDAYGEHIAATADALVDAMVVYSRDGEVPPEAKDRIEALESDCDDGLQDVRRLIGESMPPNFTEAYLRTGDLLELYRALDVIPNLIERFVVELAVTRPPLDRALRACFRDMSRRIAVATRRLVAVVTAYVERLVTDEQPVHVAPETDAIASYERDCDAIRDSVVRSTFADDVDAQALFVRELVVALDGVMDAIEDAADHILYMNSADF